MTFLPSPGDATRVSCFLADQPRWSVYWDKKHGLWRVAEDDPDSDLVTAEPIDRTTADNAAKVALAAARAGALKSDIERRA